MHGGHKENRLTERQNIYSKALNQDFLDIPEALTLYIDAPLGELMIVADRLRQIHHPGNQVTWLIDRNVNITNVCGCACKFCNFYRPVNHPEAYITSMEQYREKIEELFRLGGNRLLLQGGQHPGLGIAFYEELFSGLKKMYPDLKLHALGPPEIVHISRMENLNYEQVLSRLRKAGMDSLPGAGAEILSDRVRKIVSPAKCSATAWQDVMRTAHKLDILTSATMMFGHMETLEERMEHLAAIRQVQSEKPPGTIGFISFIPWPFQGEGTRLKAKQGVQSKVSIEEYIRMIAISRIMLPNIPNIQASWLTVGIPTAQLCLHAGANDMGSIMIEENVVSVAGAHHRTDAAGIQQAIKDAGFEPVQRDQQFRHL
ncbi:MAG: dehypoxanthine futalosine cyclase [Bacteroidetes bacterium]|nr:dehypoxanthine futalosine cyclase [Bacteroidota bacterium]